MNNQAKEKIGIDKWSSRFRGPPKQNQQKFKDKRLKFKRLELLKQAKKRFNAKKSKAKATIKKKDCSDAIADKLLELISQGKAENVDLIKTLLDELWRQTIDGGIFYDDVIRAAQKSIRDMELLS